MAFYAQISFDCAEFKNFLGEKLTKKRNLCNGARSRAVERRCNGKWIMEGSFTAMVDDILYNKV